MKASWDSKTLTIATVVTMVGSIAAAVFFGDDRYAHARDVEVIRLTLVQAIKEVRKETIDDKIFELNLIPEAKRTDAQRAMLERYKHQVEEIERERVNLRR